MNTTVEFSPGDSVFWRFWSKKLLAIFFLIVISFDVMATLTTHILVGVAILGGIMVYSYYDHECAIGVIISRADKSFTYQYLNWLGKKTEISVDLMDAEINYQLVSGGRSGDYYQLDLYNNDDNRVTIKENYSGYTSNDLDKIVEAINEARRA